MHNKTIAMMFLLSYSVAPAVSADSCKMPQVPQFIKDNPKMTAAVLATGLATYAMYKHIKWCFATEDKPLVSFDDGVTIVEAVYKNLPFMPGSNLKMYKDGKYIGCIGYMYFNGQYQIANFFVSKEYRNKGYGTRLLDTIMTLLKERGVSCVYIAAEPFEKGSFFGMKILTGQEREVAVEKLVTLYRKYGFVSLSNEEAKRSGVFVMAQATAQPMYCQLS